eukprot:8004994-Pyramimonas_sp.AAC.1
MQLLKNPCQGRSVHGVCGDRCVPVRGLPQPRPSRGHKASVTWIVGFIFLIMICALVIPARDAHAVCSEERGLQPWAFER